MEFLIILLFIFAPLIMFAIGASQFAKASQTFKEIKMQNELRRREYEKYKNK